MKRVNSRRGDYGHVPTAYRRWSAFTTRLLAVCLFGIAASTPVATLEAAPVAKLSFLNLKQDAIEAAAAGKTLMLLFEQENCSYCIALRNINLADTEIAAMVRDGFDIVALDIWGAREITDFTGTVMPEKQYARSVNVQFTPMILFLDSKGKELFRMAGYYKPPAFKAALQYVAGRHYEKLSFREFTRTRATGSVPARRSDAPFLQTTTDLPSALAVAARDDKGLALLFERSPCPDCAELRDRTLRDPRAVELLTGAFNVAAFDVFGTRSVRQLDGNLMTESLMAEKFDIRYTPTLVFLDRNGREIFRADNYRKPEHFQVVLRFLASGAYLRYPSFQDWLRSEHAARPSSP